MGGQLQPLSGKKQALEDSLRTNIAVVDARLLLGEAGALSILHGGETYKLMRTKQNKLLLTKCNPETGNGIGQHNP